MARFPVRTGLLLFIVYVSRGIFVFRDYGISWDEPVSRLNGYVNLKYLAGLLGLIQEPEWLARIPALADWHDRDYGVAFEAPLAFLEVVLGYDGPPHEAYQFRHLVTFLYPIRILRNNNQPISFGHRSEYP